MPRPSGSVIVISSHVARGSVGNRAMVFALERLGFTVWAVPTILLPYHPGHGPVMPIIPDEDRFAGLLKALVKDQGTTEIAGIISGYFASPDQVRAVRHLIETVKARQPGALYLCDPVCGDEGGLYVDASVAEALRDELLPLADAATPNAFECAWLAGGPHSGADLASLAAELAPPVVLVTSAPPLMRNHIGNLLAGAGDGPAMLIEHPALPTEAKGTGDLLAALFFARRLLGHDWAKAAELAIASTFEVVAGTAKAGAAELLLAEFQHAFVQPHAAVSVRRLAGASARPAPQTTPGTGGRSGP